MSVTGPCYCSREEVMYGLDFHPTARTITLVDRAIQSAASDTYGICHRRFHPEDGTKYFDWPLRTTSTPTRGGSGSSSTTSSRPPRSPRAATRFR